MLLNSFGPIQDLAKLQRPSRYGLRFLLLLVVLVFLVFLVFFLSIVLLCVFGSGFLFFRNFRENFSDSYPTFGSFEKQTEISEAALVEVLLGRASFPNYSESNSCYGLHIHTLNQPSPGN